MTSSRIKVIPYPTEETYTLQQFLDILDIGLELVEGRTGNWFARLVGARVPGILSRGRPSTAYLVGHFDLCLSQEAALRNAAEKLTRLHRLERADGTDIDIRNIKVVV